MILKRIAKRLGLEGKALNFLTVEGRRKTRYKFVISKNTIPGELPWRGTVINQHGEPEIHFAYETPQAAEESLPWLDEVLEVDKIIVL